MAAQSFRADRARVLWLSAVLPAVVGALLVFGFRDLFMRVLGGIPLVGGLAFLSYLLASRPPVLTLDDEGLEIHGRRHRWEEVTVGAVGFRQRGRLGMFEAFTITAPDRKIEIEGVVWPDVRAMHAALTSRAGKRAS